MKDNKIIWIIGLIIVGLLLLVKGTIPFPSSVNFISSFSIVDDSFCGDMSDAGCAENQEPVCHQEDEPPYMYYYTCELIDCSNNPSYSLDCLRWCTNPSDIYDYSANVCCPSSHPYYSPADNLCYSSPMLGSDNFFTRATESQGYSATGWNNNVCGASGECAVDGDFGTASGNEPEQTSWAEKCFSFPDFSEAILHTKFGWTSYGIPSTQTYLKKDNGDYEEFTLSTWMGGAFGDIVFPGTLGEVNTPIPQNYWDANRICFKTILNPSLSHLFNSISDSEILFPQCSIGEEDCRGDLNKELFTCSEDRLWVGQGFVVGRCSVECLIDSDCPNGRICVQQIKQCSLSSCSDGDEDCDGLNYLICSNNDWISQGLVEGECGYTLVCSDGDEDCDGLNYLICSNNDWISQGEITGHCGVGDNQAGQPRVYYRFSNNSCTQISMLPSLKTINDYNTLAICQSHITGGGGGGQTNQTCTDGIQNQDETGIDCGGNCNACEQPKNYNLYLIIAIIGVILGIYLWRRKKR